MEIKKKTKNQIGRKKKKDKKKHNNNREKMLTFGNLDRSPLAVTVLVSGCRPRYDKEEEDKSADLQKYRNWRMCIMC